MTLNVYPKFCFGLRGKSSWTGGHTWEVAAGIGVRQVLSFWLTKLSRNGTTLGHRITFNLQSSENHFLLEHLLEHLAGRNLIAYGENSPFGAG